MKQKKLVLPLILLITLLILHVSFQINTVAAQAWQIYIEPEIATSEPNTEFTVELNIKNSERIYAWYTNITWNPEILNITDATEGPFLNQEHSRKTDFIVGINYTAGWIYFGCCLKGEAATAQPSGSGTLAYLTFHVLSAGETNITLTSLSLFNWDGAISSTKYTRHGALFKYPYFTAAITPKTISNPALIANTTFSVNITAFVDGLYRWGVNLTWNNDVLEMVNATEGPFLTSGGIYTSNFTYTIVQEEGYALLNSTLLEPASPANGTGTLATITFKVKKIGESDIKLEKSELYDNESRKIVHILSHGEFTNILRDVAVLAIQAEITNNEVTIGTAVDINVQVKNKGNMLETVELKIYYGLLVISTQSISLSVNETKTVSFSWDTTSLSKGQGELKASLTTLPEETSTADNEKVYGTISLVEAAGGIAPEVLIAIIVIIVVVAAAVIIVLLKRKSPKQ